jgi:hypothetical protein
MTDRLDDLLRDAAPVTDDDLWALPLREAEAELRTAILHEPRPDAAATPRRSARARGALPRSHGGRRRRWPAVALAGGIAAVILAVGLSGGDDRLGPSPGRAWAAPALRVAHAVPRLLLDEPGWVVERADQFDVREGEMTFRNGARTLDLHWRSSDHASWVEDRAHSAKRLPVGEVTGTRAAIFRYPGSAGDFTALWRDGRYSLELRVGFGRGAEPMTIDEYRRLLASLKAVSVDEWLSAMPESVVLPKESESVVDEMLADMTLPDGFDRGALETGDAVRDRYQLGARVAGAVACAWIRIWVDARESGDAEAEAAAVSAMQGSRRWAILNEMNAAGDYPEVLWDFADAMKGNGRIMGGRGMAVEANYEEGLGC